MSKYQTLWEWIKINGTESFVLSFSKIESITGFSIDHAFLTYKKELSEFGYKINKISMKNKTVEFCKMKEKNG